MLTMTQICKSFGRQQYDLEAPECSFAYKPVEKMPFEEQEGPPRWKEKILKCASNSSFTSTSTQKKKRGRKKLEAPEEKPNRRKAGWKGPCVRLVYAKATRKGAP